ncbi:MULTISPECIES: glycosyltransferase [unclassified Streptomyces]|uniref:glycosyltransferase family 2 protein n=1 Tax=unclassified Streptomyces TaxID=2593676 RepID=UPI002DD9E9FC|nr:MULTISPECIES: glycosyltransferase [unclassified Streptomyces]WSA94403.1 glycosyltransferase [Streptomyces sp. NBC_01795]WSB78821.1 glycosyltransferase [Streptomyces sp. NBC_01775]WSS12976.1 glycosyltransferase [Streptomyces sp. NBC_01186]WSS41759.1 glycosyltransferase [Streptomyces sp. NBC_01187]
MSEVPDVSVVVAVYNTMPYLTSCLASLGAQTLDERRMEVIVVDDGSTDGGTAEIERFAARHPGLVVTVWQPNSGGPAAPSNRGLELARGRYVFFLGADDHLAPEALERMVITADRCRSDVLLCKMAAVGERTVPTGVFARSSPAIRLVGDGLPWALSNTKLFRRSLIERHGIRYDETMPAFSDQPFVLEACFRAGRISVLADQVHYFAVRRSDSSNITYRAGPEVRLRCVERIFETTCRFLDPGPLRDAFHRRHFHVELFQLFGPDFPGLDQGARQRVCTGAARLIGAHGDGVLERLDLRRRRTLELAWRGDVAALCAEIAADPERSPRSPAADSRFALVRWLMSPVRSSRPVRSGRAAHGDGRQPVS